MKLQSVIVPALVAAAVIGGYILFSFPDKPPVPQQPSQTNKIPTEFSLSSLAFANDGQIPERHTCDGENISPPFAIANIPDKAKSLVFIMDDPDAPSGTWTHWVLWDIPPTVVEIAEGKVPEWAVEGMTSSGKPGYTGPCPPSGSHRYFFTIYALDELLRFNNQTTRKELESAMTGHLVGQAHFFGRYSRK